MKTLDHYTEILLRQQQAARDVQLEHRRRLQLVQEPRRPRFYRAALIRLGKRLVVWGMKLQMTSSEDLLLPHEVSAPYNQ